MTLKKRTENLNDFIQRYPDVYEAYRQYGKAVHEEGGPIEEKTRWLIKVALSAASGYKFALRTHVEKARKSGCTTEEIEHAILLIAPTVGFPKMMEAMLVLHEEEPESAE
jgi:AhpD family alkylhydroperoxidase